jgi:hypothetical protein
MLLCLQSFEAVGRIECQGIGQKSTLSTRFVILSPRHKAASYKVFTQPHSTSSPTLSSTSPACLSQNRTTFAGIIDSPSRLLLATLK